MRGSCKCGIEIDEVEFTQFGMCTSCFTIKLKEEKIECDLNEDRLHEK